MKICKKCNLEYDDSVSFCGYCGSALVPEIQVSSCPYCGKKLDNQYTFCPYCGKGLTDATGSVDSQTDVESQLEQSPPETIKSAGNKYHWLIIAILMIIDIFAGLWFITFFKGFLRGKMGDLSLNDFLLVELGSLFAVILCCFLIKKLRHNFGKYVVIGTVWVIGENIVGVLFAFPGTVIFNIFILIYIYISYKNRNITKDNEIAKEVNDVKREKKFGLANFIKTNKSGVYTIATCVLILIGVVYFASKPINTNYSNSKVSNINTTKTSMAKINAKVNNSTNNISNKQQYDDTKWIPHDYNSDDNINTKPGIFIKQFMDVKSMYYSIPSIKRIDDNTITVQLYFFPTKVPEIDSQSQYAKQYLAYKVNKQKKIEKIIMKDVKIELYKSNNLIKVKDHGIFDGSYLYTIGENNSIENYIILHSI